MSGVEVFYRDNETGKPVPVSATTPLPVTGGTGGEGGSTDMTETNSRLGAKTETAPADDTASSGLNGRLQRIAQHLTSLLGKWPTSLGAKAASGSFPVTASSEDVARIGDLTETAPATDTGSSGLNGRLQRIAQHLSTLVGFGPPGDGGTDMTATNTLLGAVDETAPASDTASSGLNGRLQRAAQRLTSLIALVPASLGAKAAASSFAVTASTEDVAQVGSLTETAPASDTASSGLNGRLQRIAQRITSMIALLPASLGSKAAASSFAVTASTEDIARQGIITETAPASDTASSGQNGRLQRLAQHLSTLIATQPASLGAKAASASFPVTQSTEDAARIGATDETIAATDTSTSGLNGLLKRIATTLSTAISRIGANTETAPASDTASSGLNGRLQRIAQNLTTLIGGAKVIGATAANSPLTVAPVTSGGLAKTANPTAVSDADVVNALFDKLGKQVTVGALRELKAIQQTSITVNTETTIVTAAGSGVFADLYGLALANRSATGVYVTIKDATAGTTRSVIYVPANDTRGFMLEVGSAIPQASANNNWTATVSSAVTAIEVTAMYVKNT